MHPSRLFAALAVLPLLALALTSGCADDDGRPLPEDGAFIVAAAWNPDPPAVGQNTLTLTVTDASGAAVTGATVVVDPQMPTHGHGSSEDPVITEVGAGVYTATPVTFQMPGAWEITVDATLGDDHGTLVIDLTVN